MTDQKPIQCPKCEHDLPIAVFEQAKDRARCRYVIHPMDGQLLRAETIGGQLTGLAKLMRAAGKAVGSKTVLFVEKITTGDDGSIELHLIDCIAKEPRP